MLVLGIETTCDETAASVVRRDEDGRGEILSDVVLSQTAEHQPYGGVVPEIAARAHVEVLDRIIAQAMTEAALSFSMLDGVAAAADPADRRRDLRAHHREGDRAGRREAADRRQSSGSPALTARLTDNTAFPYCLFLASRGHTLLRCSMSENRRIGTTVDDASRGLRQDAKLLGLAYPAVRVEREAPRGDVDRFISAPDARPRRSRLPSPAEDGPSHGSREGRAVDDHEWPTLRWFQQAVVDVVMTALRAGLRMFRERFGGPTALVVAGGVAVNQSIRRALHRVATEQGTVLVAPPPELCTDNGAMIAWAGCERLVRSLTDTLDVAPRARWPLDGNEWPRRGERAS